MREVAEEDLQDFQCRPDLKLAWGVNLDLADLVDLAGAAYNNQIYMTHNAELANGSKTAADSPDPVHPSSSEGAVFDPLSTDVMPIPLLAEEDPPSELAEVLERYYICQACSGGQIFHFQPVVWRPSMPELEITMFSVPAPPTAHPHSCTMTPTNAKILMDTPDSNHMDITIDWDKTAPVIYWQTPLPSVRALQSGGMQEQDSGTSRGSEVLVYWVR